MKETNEERVNRIYGDWNYEDNIANEDVDWLIERAKLSVKHEEALKEIADNNVDTPFARPLILHARRTIDY